VLETITDITERKEAEAARRRLDALIISNQKLETEIIRQRTLEETRRQTVHHQSQLLEQSNRMQEQMRWLSRQVLVAQEEERKEISRELHDVIAQTLTGINVRLAALKKAAAINTDGLDKNIAQTQRLVERSVDIVHQFARELRPAVLDDLGLIPALHTFLKDFSARTGVHVDMTASSQVEQLQISHRTALFRVAQEALTNVARHAGASRVEVSLRHRGESVMLTIKDDGKSFNAERAFNSGSKRLGLLGMRERVEMIDGTFSIESSPGLGTTIQVQIPLVMPKKATPKKPARFTLKRS
jgi:signal transduction histidine kinase